MRSSYVAIANARPKGREVEEELTGTTTAVGKHATVVLRSGSHRVWCLQRDVRRQTIKASWLKNALPYRGQLLGNSV
jgi:hypothetical protein